MPTSCDRVREHLLQNCANRVSWELGEFSRTQNILQVGGGAMICNNQSLDIEPGTARASGSADWKSIPWGQGTLP
jgi:hypothetical protein